MSSLLSAGAHHRQTADRPLTFVSRYHPLTEDADILESYRSATERLCSDLLLSGRILIGQSSDAEGINGTLAGRKADLDAYVNCMLGVATDEVADDPARRRAVESFRDASGDFFRRVGVEPLVFADAADFKWSSAGDVGDGEGLFPDLNVKIVKEIISTGGVFSSIKTQDTSVGYLSPKEWHQEMMSLLNKKNHEGGSSDKEDEVETILIDVRNHKECQVGAFLPGISIDPNTKTFASFPQWVQENSKAELDNKRILTYCTGGIRCEKASAYIRKLVPNNKGVFHLKGGIHKYIEEFNGSTDECLFKGRNFVFDRRGGMDASDCVSDVGASIKDGDVIGQCQYCSKPYDVFHHDVNCTVCREPVLACSSCRQLLVDKHRDLRSERSHAEHEGTKPEYHCGDHFHLKDCYYTDLSGFAKEELEAQTVRLEEHTNSLEALGKKGKQKRRTLRKQLEKITAQLNGETNPLVNSGCRHCGRMDCSGRCWGFHGLGRSAQLKELKVKPSSEAVVAKKQRVRASKNQRPSKKLKSRNDAAEIEILQLCQPPAKYRNEKTGLRCPPPVVRVLRSKVKGRWVGKSLQWLLTNELSLEEDSLEEQRKAGLIKIDDKSVHDLSVALQNMQTVNRILFFQEPPVAVPEKIAVTRHYIGHALDSDDGCLFCIDKPPSVPVHPAGPYLANTLLRMVEAQEGLAPKSITPLHRIDRCTSGCLLGTNSAAVARVVQGLLASKKEGAIKKLYLAVVRGRFPSDHAKITLPSEQESSCTISGRDNDDNVIQVDAPIATHLKHGESKQCNSMMRRVIRNDGKPSRSLFKMLSYDSTNDRSLISCCPVTGRGHQLRVHLQLIGFPIHNDVEYGGVVSDEVRKKQISESIEAMLSASSSAETCRKLESINDDESSAAIRLGASTKGAEGIRASFSSSHLLGGGHMIDLHAFKYRMETDTAVEVGTDLPPWAVEFGIAETETKLTWLN